VQAHCAVIVGGIDIFRGGLPAATFPGSQGPLELRPATTADMRPLSAQKAVKRNL
jgi:hypothetical protein